MCKAGRLDAVVNNADFSTRGVVEDTTIETAKAQFETNFFGVLRVCQVVLPALRAGRRLYHQHQLAGGACRIAIYGTLLREQIRA